jgi:GT2 family glycosyltransferase
MLFIDDIPLLGKFLKPYQLRDHKAFTSERLMGWVGGTAMMIRRDVTKKIGLLNEDMFMYAEDIEFCMRAHEKGFLVAITPDAKIIHYGQQSSGGAPKAAWLGEYKGLKYIFNKHKPSWEYPVLRMLLKTGALLRIFVFGILQGRRDAYEAYKEAFNLA